MTEDEIVSAIHETTGIDSIEHRTEAVQATLRVLAQRLAGGETQDIAAQLPAAFADTLPQSGGGQRFSVSEFYERVAESEGLGCTAEQARAHARAVMAVLKVALSDGEYADLMGQLPDEYDDLLGLGPVH